MIIDRIEEQERYYPLLPEMEEAFAFLAEAADLDEGRYELDGGMFATISEGETRQMDEVMLEAHQKYIDLQYCIAGGERMSWAHVQELEMAEAHPERDFCTYRGASTSFSVRPGMFYIMFPCDAHKGGCHREFPKHFRKVVVKIPVPEK